MDTLHIQLGVMGLIWLVSQVLVRTRSTGKCFKVTEYNDGWDYNLSRGTLSLVAPILLPYFLGETMIARIQRRFHRKRVKFLKRRLRQDGSLPKKQQELLEESQTIAATKLCALREKIVAIAPDDGAPYFIPIWLFGAIPVAAIVCFTWIPGLHGMIGDLGVTEAAQNSLNHVGNWLTSFGK